MTEYTAADDLIAEELPGEDLTLPSGKTVRLRGLSRAELIRHGHDKASADVVEVRNVAACLISPKITQAQAKRWQETSSAGGDFRVLSERIRDLSGLGEGAQKSGVAAAGD